MSPTDVLRMSATIRPYSPMTSLACQFDPILQSVGGRSRGSRENEDEDHGDKDFRLGEVCPDALRVS